jgi:hypothetical protein
MLYQLSYTPMQGFGLVRFAGPHAALQLQSFAVLVQFFVSLFWPIT